MADTRTPAEPVSYLVETGLPLEDGTVPEWVVRSGYGTRDGARREVRQLSPRWRRMGLRVRVTVSGPAGAPVSHAAR